MEDGGESRWLYAQAVRLDGLWDFGANHECGEQGKSVQVFAAFTISVDGTVSNSPPTQATASADGSMTAEDAVRAIAEDKINKILLALKTGKVVKAG